MRLSVNINKVATLRNARGANNPDILYAASCCEQFGADGITVHPRPDERHIRYEDVRQLGKILKTEFNIEGNPREQAFVDLVLEVLPAQVTLVPDHAGQLTSNHGWDTKMHQDFLKEMVALFSSKNIRVSLFADPDTDIISYAQKTGTHRVELYTEAYAKAFSLNKSAAIAPYIAAAKAAISHGMDVNAGHDLDLNNLKYFVEQIPEVKEVSIGHALICDALYLGLENTIQMYKRCLH